jgi:hypothetical protein
VRVHPHKGCAVPVGREDRLRFQHWRAIADAASEFKVRPQGITTPVVASQRVATAYVPHDIGGAEPLQCGEVAAR